MDPLNVPAELILDIALGLHPHDKIAQKHGITEHDLLKLHTQEWFNRQVNAQRESLEKAGFDFKAKVKLLAEDMVVDVYHAANLKHGALDHVEDAQLVSVDELQGESPAVVPAVLTNKDLA